MIVDKSPDDREWSGNFQVLSLDGGGIKGIFAAALLAAIEEDTGTKVVDHFDLITGTSTGGLVALALGLGKSPKEIVEFYLQKGRKIFANPFEWRWVLKWIYRKYPSKPLIGALKECFGDHPLGDSTKRLVIPSYNLGEDGVYLFRTPHHVRLARDFKVPMWQIAAATTAAPTFFRSATHVDELRLIDGGTWANNPIMVGLVEAFGTLRVPLEQISILSIGTSEVVRKIPKRLDSGGIVAWAIGNSVINTILHGQSIAALNQARFLLGASGVLRINPQVPAKEFALDGTLTMNELFAKARHYSRIEMPEIAARFLQHPASQYIPIHK